ncbi:MAG: AAA family ATPase [Rubrobacter sp.]
MHLQSVHIENYRGLKDIFFELPTSTTVIVGVNAIGKSSILEAIRLTQAILAPRFLGEGQLVLQSLSAHVPSLNAVKYDALVGDTNHPMRIALKIKLSHDEIQRVKNQLPLLAQLHVRNILGNVATDDLALVQYLSSPQGQEQYNNALAELGANVQELDTSPLIDLTLDIDASNSTVRGGNLFHQEVAQSLVQSIPPSLGALTYFPADRAMPSGEVAIQIGSADTQQQLYSHLGQPAQKYQRLKQHLVNQRLTEASAEMEEDFALVFDELLTGKELDALALTQEGMLTVRIREPETNAFYDIDSMSSGEKGLLLTFFLMKRSTAHGGIILLDEPELHLNPAVSRKIVPFLREQVLEPLGIQAIICTHSPEITAHAFDDSESTLLYLRASTDITPILRTDKAEVYEAIERLGSEPSDIMFSQGSVYVEGEHDAELLTTGWPDRVGSYKITELGGQGEVEKQIKTLQAEEQKDKLDNPQCFIFDLDRRPTSLTDTPLVKVRQWNKHSLENYLLDPIVIYDVAKANNFKNVPTRGALRTKLQTIALNQLQGIIARDVYADAEPDNPGFRAGVASKVTYAEMGEELVARLVSIKEELADLEPSEWVEQFVSRCEAKDREQREDWRDNWQTHANGKLVLNETYKQLGPQISFLDFKRQIVSAMQTKNTQNWQEVDRVLASALQS